MRNKRSAGRDALSYIAFRWPLFLYALVSGGLIWAYLSLQGKLPQEDVRYALLLLFSALAVFALPDFLLFRSKLKRLRQILNELNEPEHALPEGKNALERAYVALIKGFYERAEAEKAALTKTHRASEAYFTQWIHQIKTPIASMRLLLEAPEADRALLKRQLFEVERYAELAMQYVRSEDMAADLVLTKTPLEPLVRECVKKYAPLFIGKRLTAEVGALALAPVTDAKWLAFVIEQLLSNAVKYTHTGGMRVYLSGRTLVIEDTGSGIRPEDIERVFERGYTGQNGRLDKRATGIGLYLARRAAKALSIQLALDSTPGKGTRAMLAFPPDPHEYE